MGKVKSSSKSSSNSVFFENLVSVGTKREDFCEIVLNHSVCLKKQAETQTDITYTAMATRDIKLADAVIVGKYLIDVSYEAVTYYTFSDYKDTKGQGYQFYSAKQVMGGQDGVYTVDKSTALNPCKKLQIRVSVALDEEHKKHITSLLRIYEIVMILYYIKQENTEDALFRKWISCSTREMQINHITGNYIDSLKPELLEICTNGENLKHSAVLMKFRTSTFADFAVFMVTVDDCERATQELLQNGSKARPVDKFRLIAEWETAVVI